MDQTRVLVVDDHDVVRNGVIAIIREARPEWKVCAEAQNGLEAVAAAESLHPDLVVLDIRMPVMDGLEAARRILKKSPGSRIMMLSVCDSPEDVIDALRAGAQGYVLKTEARSDLVPALDALRQGNTYFSPRISGLVLYKYLAGSPDIKRNSVLSPRELQVLKLMAECKSTDEVASALNISKKTVGSHRARLMKKLGLRSNMELVQYALRRHIIEP